LLLRNDGKSRYREFQVTGRLRLQERHHVYVSYVRSSATGDLNAFNDYFGNLRNPVIRANERSLQPFDAPNRLLAPMIWRSAIPVQQPDFMRVQARVRARS